MLSGATFYECINTIDQFIKPVLDNKMSIFEVYVAFNNFPCISVYKDFVFAQTSRKHAYIILTPLNPTFM